MIVSPGRRNRPACFLCAGWPRRFLYTKAARDKKIFELWLACRTQQEIAEAVGMTQKGVDKVLEQNERFRFVLEPDLFYEIKDEGKRWEAIIEHNRRNAQHLIDFDPCLARSRHIGHAGG
ncbi:MAG: hypothetical protein ACREV4_08520 [Gammaproteobacteria bacterium]